MTMREYEVLTAIVVRTDLERETAMLWLQERLITILGPQDAIDVDTTHLDSFWFAEDDRPNPKTTDGLRSAVFVPKPLTQEEASSLLEKQVRRNTGRCSFCGHEGPTGNDMYDHVIEYHMDELTCLGALFDPTLLADSQDRIAAKNLQQNS
jgi:hypothetical protein